MHIAPEAVSAGAPDVTVNYSYGYTAGMFENVTGSTTATYYNYDTSGQPVSLSNTITDDFCLHFSAKDFDQDAASYYYGYRYYNSAIGRWANRDPIGEFGGVALYGFVGNEPVGRWDWFGMWSEPRRTGARTAEVDSEKGDTVLELAKAIQLDEEEFKLWLEPVGDAKMPASFSEEVEDCKTFTVPNTVYISYGNLSPSVLEVYYGTVANMNEVESDYSKEGYYVLHRKPNGYAGNTLQQTQNGVAYKHLAVWAHGGHGRKTGLLFGVDQNHLSVAPPSSFKPHHKLSEVILYACYQGVLADAWFAAVVSKRGSLYAWPKPLPVGRWNGRRYESLAEYTIPQEGN